MTGRAIWECDAFGTFFAEGGKAFYRPAINDGAGDRVELMAAGRMAAGPMARRNTLPLLPAHMINFEWLEHGAGANRIFPASADLLDAAGRTVITSYAVHRPDGNWSLMLINHDLNAGHTIHIVMDDARRVSHPFAGSVALVQYCNTPAEDKNITIAATRDGMYTLPSGSITVIRGKLQ